MTNVSTTIGRSLLGTAILCSIALGWSAGAGAAVPAGVNDNICIGPVVVNETLTIHRDSSTHTYYGTADFVSSSLTESYPFSYVAESAHKWSGTIILVDDDPILREDTLLHVHGAAYFSEGGYVAMIQGARFNICKVFGDPGGTRL
jgi:hypothetical protein